MLLETGAVEEVMPCVVNDCDQVGILKTDRHCSLLFGEKWASSQNQQILLEVVFSW